MGIWGVGGGGSSQKDEKLNKMSPIPTPSPHKLRKEDDSTYFDKIFPAVNFSNTKILINSSAFMVNFPKWQKLVQWRKKYKNKS